MTDIEVLTPGDLYLYKRAQWKEPEALKSSSRVAILINRYDYELAAISKAFQSEAAAYSLDLITVDTYKYCNFEFSGTRLLEMTELLELLGWKVKKKKTFDSYYSLIVSYPKAKKLKLPDFIDNPDVSIKL